MLGDIKDLSAHSGGWSEDNNGTALRWSGKFRNFTDAPAAVNMIGAIAETHDHHPDIEFGYGYVRLKITTHDADGLTKKDFELADALKGVLEPA